MLHTDTFLGIWFSGYVLMQLVYFTWLQSPYIFALISKEFIKTKVCFPCLFGLSQLYNCWKVMELCSTFEHTYLGWYKYTLESF